MAVETVAGAVIDCSLLPKADRIHALRALASSLDPTDALRLLELATLAESAQAVAVESLAHAIESRGSLGYFRESRPQAFAAHKAVQRDTRIAGVFPYGAGRAVLNAASAILFENEALEAGQRVRETLIGPMVDMFGPESTWTELAGNSLRSAEQSESAVLQRDR
ncbi:hypothetical protein [Prescottella agglutinans]|nr:hypothetical protein [Prescottella agglutinans]